MNYCLLIHSFVIINISVLHFIYKVLNFIKNSCIYSRLNFMNILILFLIIRLACPSALRVSNNSTEVSVYCKKVIIERNLKIKQFKFSILRPGKLLFTQIIQINTFDTKRSGFLLPTMVTDRRQHLTTIFHLGHFTSFFPFP